MTTRYRRYLGRAERRRQQHAPLRSQQVAMTYVIDREGSGRAAARSFFGPFIEYVVRLMEREQSKTPPILHNGRKPR